MISQLSSVDAPSAAKAAGATVERAPIDIGCVRSINTARQHRKNDRDRSGQTPGYNQFLVYRALLILFGGCFVHAGHSQSPTGSSLMFTHSQWNHWYSQ